MRGADLLVQTLKSAGVTRIFSLSGNQIMPIYDACVDAQIEIVHTRHEAAAVFMADAYAQLTGEPGICLVTAAPGAANGIGPLYSARLSESPVIYLTGDSPLILDGKGSFQELDQVSMSRPVTKLSFRARDAAALGDDMARAICCAVSGRPGPVHVALPFDVVEGDATAGVIPTQNAFEREVRVPDMTYIVQILHTLSAASAPLVVCGPCLNETRSGNLLEQLADALDTPVIVMESPRGLNDPSLGRLTDALASADMVVSLGKVIDFSLGYGSASDVTCLWTVIDADVEAREQARRNLDGRSVVFVDADPRDAINAFIEHGAGGNSRKLWRDKVKSYLVARNYPAISLASDFSITPLMLCEAVQQQVALSESSIVICDGGEFGQWAQAVTNADYRVTNGLSGAIGGSLCYALAAKKAKPDAMVFALMGDGTVGFHFAEFETAVRENTPFVAIVGNDQRWNAEHLIQLREYGSDRLIGCQLSDARYDLAVEALGGYGEYVTDTTQLGDALKRAIDSNLPACVNVMMAGQPAPGVMSPT